ncbi:MAG: hypothetical protein QGF21_11480 [Vicinamibacterales bacterium]|jgi:hypothetical protein|nr:hypothetical protein [Acidobacteriota bacterium]MDP7471356.1 hypothetical protein [Vicinamibacterales bacterium]MDP7672552.1 hypothetical protein [Vicinamibacterales bacterium]HJO39729.1 hypothetical protein [Vicinamibacterales bacterium]|tara:strand:- start:2639 stop:2836 length:198 start_codon:yes stop_codon:yes gene_type:complete
MTRFHIPRAAHLALVSALLLALPTAAAAQRNGQPASDQIGQEDIWGNPTFVGGVTNGGAAGHSIW